MKKVWFKLLQGKKGQSECICMYFKDNEIDIDEDQERKGKFLFF